MRNDPDAVMLFAAGFGTRMGALTERQPKPMIKVAGMALIDHALQQVEAAGVPRKVANLHYLPKPLVKHLATRDVTPSIELPEILETGGGLRQALPLLGESPVFTMNTDAVWSGANPLHALRRAWNPETMDALLLLIEPAAAFGHNGKGDFLRDPSGTLSRGPGLVYSGVQIIKTEGLAQISDRVFSLNLLWDRMLEKGALHGIVHEGGWCDVGRPENIATAEAMLKAALHV